MLSSVHLYTQMCVCLYTLKIKNHPLHIVLQPFFFHLTVHFAECSMAGIKAVSYSFYFFLSIIFLYKFQVYTIIAQHTE